MWLLANPDFLSVRHQLSGETVKDLRLDAASHTLRYLGGPEGSWGPLVHTLDLGPMFTAPWGRAPAPTQYSRSGRQARCRPAGPGRPARPRARPGANLPLRRAPAAHHRRPGGQRPQWIEWRDIVFTPDDRKLVIAGEPGPSAVIRIWDVGKKAVTATIPDAAGRPVLSPDGALLTTTQGTAYRLPSGTPLPPSRTPGRAAALAFSPDGKYLAVGDGSGRVGLRDGRITRRLGELADPDTSTSPYVSALAFTPDSRTLAVAGDEGSVQLRDSTTHQRVGMPLPTAGDAIGSLVFESDHVLRAVGSHTAAHTYELSPQAATRAICRRTGKQITPANGARTFPKSPTDRPARDATDAGAACRRAGEPESGEPESPRNDE